MKEQERSGIAEIMPDLNSLNRPFWEGLKDNKLMIQHCKDCNSYQFPPSTKCISCLSDNVVWTEASGEGTLWSWVVFWKQYLKPYPGPSKVALVKLKEGPLVLARMAHDVEVDLDASVRATFIRTADDSYLLGFEPAT